MLWGVVESSRGIDPFFGQVLVFGGVVVTAVFGYLGLRRSKKVEKDLATKGDLTLAQQVDWLVQQQVEFQAKGWQNLPADISTADRLAAFLENLDGKADDVLAKLDEHVLWEMEQKYMSPGEIRELVLHELERHESRKEQ